MVTKHANIFLSIYLSGGSNPYHKWEKLNFVFSFHKWCCCIFLRFLDAVLPKLAHPYPRLDFGPKSRCFSRSRCTGFRLGFEWRLAWALLQWPHLNRQSEGHNRNSQEEGRLVGIEKSKFPEIIQRGLHQMVWYSDDQLRPSENYLCWFFGHLGVFCSK